MEKKIIKARLNGYSFCELNENACRVAIDQIMFRGAAISGCALPQTEMFAKFIAEELTELINEFGYNELTQEELLLALRLNASVKLKYPSGLDIEPVRFEGTCFNVVYISKILANYKTLRDNLDRKLQNLLDGH